MLAVNTQTASEKNMAKRKEAKVGGKQRSRLQGHVASGYKARWPTLTEALSLPEGMDARLPNELEL